MTDQTIVSRRALLAGMAAGAATLAAGAFIVPAGQAVAAPGSVEPFNARNKQYGFLVRPENCSNCGKCVDACRKHSETPPEAPSRRKITAYKKKDAEGEVYVSTSCMHCVEPSCLSVCPAGAIEKKVGGIVAVNKDRCIGCKYCYQACPFGVLQYNDEAMDKCDCCLGAGVRPGEETWCAKACKFDALRFGLIDELLEACPEATVVQAPTKPSLLMA